MHPNGPLRLLRLLTLIVPAMVLAACGNGDGQEPIPGTPQPTLTGVLVDSPVAGVTWKTSGGRSGVTNTLGEFEYTQPESGTYVETITFSIGDIVLGTVPGIPFKGDRLYVTAVELTNSAAPTDRAATNMLVFIQSIDEDEDPTNGITISDATREAAVGVFDSLDFDSEDFSFDSREQVVEVIEAIAPGNRVVTDTEALDHFYTTYAALGGADTFDWPGGFPGYPPVGEGSDEFTLVFADEFDTDGPPNPQVWNIDQGYGPNDFGWGNDEWQLYTDSPDNLRVEDGNLVITALCDEPCGVRDDSITSGRITTNDKFEFRYGKVVARIKPPVGKGTWPAFWSLGANFPEVGWPRSGEIDFVEVFNNTNNNADQSAEAERTATSAMHWCDEVRVPDPSASCFGSGGRVFVTEKLELAESLNDDFQIWEADWNADRVIISINGIQYFELEIDPATMEEFRRDFFLLLNVAMGGTLGSGGSPPTGNETFPQTMLVDYVRVYQRVDDITPPELTEVTIASNNADPAFATISDVVTVSLTANEPIVEPIVTIGGSAATTVTGSGTDWQASRAVTGEDADDVIEFAIEYEDLAGNLGFPVTESTDGSRVTVDTTAPSLNSVSIASDNNVDPSLAKAGDVVTVTLNANEVIRPPVVTIGGIAATTVGSVANWTASRTLTVGEDQGVIAFSINYEDLAGNAGVGVPVTDTTNSSSVTVDTIAPTLTIDGALLEFLDLMPINLEFNFSEPVNGFELGDIEVTNGVATNLVDDGVNFTADVTPTGIGDLIIGVAAGAAADATGNASEAAAPVRITNGLPADTPLLTTVSIVSDNANPAFARTGNVVTVSMTADRDIDPPTVTIAGFPADSVTGAGDTWQATRAMLATDPETLIAFAVNFQDTLGNPGFETTTTTDGSSVEFDITDPTLSIEGLPTEIDFLDPISATFRFGEDVSGFDVDDIDVTNGVVDGFAAIDAAFYTAEITPDGAGDVTVAVADGVATDAAGNGNEAASESSTVDSAWGLVWSDDFDGAGLDAALWTARTDADCPDPCDGAQSYLSERVTVAGGLLTIEARDEGAGAYTSGVVDTRDKRALAFGRVEIDAVMPGTQGTLPSLRLLPAIPGGEVLPVYGPWPQSGEIDVVNAPNLGPSNSMLEHTLRYGLPQPEDTATTANSAAPGVPTLDLIEYAIEWEGGEIRWFVNGVHVATQTQDNWYAYFEDADGVYTLGADAAPFDQDFYVVIGLAVGSNADSFFPQTLEIDAVRVYECVNPVDPAIGSGCSTGAGVPAEIAPADPYIEMLEVYTDAPATLDFVEPDGVTTVSGTLNPFTFADSGAVVLDNIAATDGSDIFWNVNIAATSGAGGVVMGAEGSSASASTRYFDLSGGGTAGELLFRMRVNSAGGDPQLVAGINDRDDENGTVPLEFVADGQWRNYSVKIADIVADSVQQGSGFDIDNVFGLFGIEATGGDVNLDVDDIQVKVACRDVGGCEATPRSESVPATVVYSEDFEGLNAAAPDALSDAGFLIFADVWDGPVTTGTFLYSYGAFPAPNPGAGPGFAQLINDPQECFAEAGTQCLNAFSDYNNQDHTPGRTCGSAGGSVGCTINSSVLSDLRGLSNPIGAADIGLCWTFTGDYKAPTVGGIAEPGTNGTTNAFIVTLDPNETDPITGGWVATNEERFDTTAASKTEFARFSVDVDLADPLLIGQVLQIGFNTRATNFEDSGVYYDNLEVSTRPGACPGDP